MEWRKNSERIPVGSPVLNDKTILNPRDKESTTEQSMQNVQVGEPMRFTWVI